MKVPAVRIRKIEQIDNYSFDIEWSDNLVKRYKLSDLQKSCPCAHCVDEATGKRIVKMESVREDVRAYKIFSVGRYALRVQFTDGCSTGIYSYEFLYHQGVRR